MPREAARGEMAVVVAVVGAICHILAETTVQLEQRRSTQAVEASRETSVGSKARLKLRLGAVLGRRIARISHQKEEMPRS